MTFKTLRDDSSLLTLAPLTAVSSQISVLVMLEGDQRIRCLLAPVLRELVELLNEHRHDGSDRHIQQVLEVVHRLLIPKVQSVDMDITYRVKYRRKLKTIMRLTRSMLLQIFKEFAS
ncbi:hypothetical protein RR46_00013 [Papilio xuthus]|uniref:Uncharacterized protein n=1 Tax=Papilio xuthus TaxID=66420 RepID=A0A0N1PIH6_PAPXU|nr:hypothetical protein RR46_00013 [Papilio xuthus]